MATCPHCQQLVDSQALRCPHCAQVLKAYNHPGIPLHQARGDGFLCDDCLYEQDDSCNFPQRPYAKNCTLYQNAGAFKEQPLPLSLSKRLRLWLFRHRGLLLLMGLIVISIIITIF